jgi:CRP-like cAMP-binding protein
VVIKRIFGSGGGAEKPPQELDIDDLVVLERYAEAEDRLKARVKANPNDLHAHLRLADVYFATGQTEKAVEQFVYVAGEYGDDGFHEKGLALLSKALKLVPGDPQLLEQYRELEERKSLEHRRTLAIDGFLQSADRSGSGQGTNALLEAQQLWLHLVETKFVKRLAGDQLKRLFAATRIVYLRMRDILVKHDEEREALYLVARGALEAVVETDGGLRSARAFAVGDVVGESALFERKAWPATYRATENATLLQLDKTGLEQALLGNPDPRALLEALRDQRQDREVSKVVADLLTDA